MGQTLTNNTGLNFAREDSLGVLPGSPDWKGLEPNAINEFGSDITTVARDPISKSRQRRKGTTTDLDAAFEYDGDMTLDSFTDFIEAFLFSTAVNSDLTFTGIDVGATGFTIPSATAAQAAKLQFTAAGPISLLYATGYLTAANNGLHPLTVDVAATDLVMQFSGATAETAPTNADVSIAGIRAEAGDLALAIVGTVGTLSSGNGTPVTQLDFTTIGLTVGQRIHIGGTADANRFGSTAAADGTRSFGSARVTAITAAALTIDKIDATLVASDGTDDGVAGTEIPVDLLFGRFIRNVDVDSSEYAAISYQFEAAYANLFETDPPTPVANPDGFEYTKGCLANLLTWNMPLTDKATATFAFVGTNAEEPVDNASRKAGASTARDPLFTGALNTTADFFRLRIADTDETGLTSDFKDMTITMNNNVTPEKVLGLLGARFMNTGNFEFDIETQALFTSALVPARIRSNATVSMDWLVKNDDGAIAVDVPSATMGSDGKDFTVNESIKINLTVQAFKDATFGTSIGVSLFPVFPTV